MKAAIMQPYLFPYIGYWQLINAVDIFVLLDDVNFIKRGYINRNSILINGKPYVFSIPVKDVSQNRLIKDMKLCFDRKEKKKFLTRLELAYRKAPFFDSIFSLMRTSIETDTENLTDYIWNSIELVTQYLKIATIVVKSSELVKDNTLTGQDRIIEICKRVHANIYINLSGGRKLYHERKFREHGIELFFLDTKFERISYSQFENSFVENLSIIDILMFNSVEKIKEYLEEYELNG